MHGYEYYYDFLQYISPVISPRVSSIKVLIHIPISAFGSPLYLYVLIQPELYKY
jgi:hypothetical protein